MANDYSFIGEWSKEILVDGKNKLKVFVSHLNLTDYDTELIIKFGNETIYKYNPTSAYCLYFDIPVDWLRQIPDSPLGTGTITLKTWSKSSELLHEDVKTFTAYVPEEFKPEISVYNVKMYETGVVDYAVYGLTRPMVQAMVTPHSTSPIKKYYITGGGISDKGDFKYTSDDDNYNFWTYGTVFKTWGSNITLTLTVEDERGRTAKVESEPFYIHPYTRPSINDFRAYRTDKDGITKPDGDHIKVLLDAMFSSIRDGEGNEINGITCYVDWKTVNGSYTNFTEYVKDTPFIFEADKDLNYEIKCVVRDKYRETEAFCNVIGDKKDFNICDGGGGAAIGQKAEKGYFDVAYNTRIGKKLSAKEEITSNKGLISTGTGSKGDFLYFGEAERVITYTTPGGATYYGDFNECTNIGIYCIWKNADTEGYDHEKVHNVPCNKAGTLRVYYANGTSGETENARYLIQEYVTYDGKEVYRRSAWQYRTDSTVDWPYMWEFDSWYRFAGTKV